MDIAFFHDIYHCFNFFHIHENVQLLDVIIIRDEP